MITRSQSGNAAPIAHLMALVIVAIENIYCRDWFCETASMPIDRIPSLYCQLRAYELQTAALSALLLNHMSMEIFLWDQICFNEFSSVQYMSH
jgi:hypothetical protein